MQRTHLPGSSRHLPPYSHAPFANFPLTEHRSRPERAGIAFPRYHGGMNDRPASGFAFDPAWLDALAQLSARLSARTPRLVDLYLERKLELVASAGKGRTAIREIRTEGIAARWASPVRTVMAARNGISHAVLRDLLDQAYQHIVVPPLRPAAVAEIDPPPGWRHWAERLVTAAAEHPLDLRLTVRQAAVVTDGTWRPVDAPPLLHVRHAVPPAGNLLAVWGHPLLNRWLERLLIPPPPTRWMPRPGTRLPVLFSEGSGGALIHEIAGHLSESDLVLAGGSPLASLQGALVGPASLQITDDPTRRDLPGAFSCDDEGVPARPLTIIRDGILEAWLCDRHGSLALGGPAGRGRRASWELPPISRMSNLVVRPGETDPGSLERAIERGLVVTRTGGASVDAESGLAVIVAEEGWEVREGKRRRPLAPCRLAAPAIRTLATLDPAVGNDPEPDWRLGWCVKDGLAVPTGMETPSLLAYELQVL